MLGRIGQANEATERESGAATAVPTPSRVASLARGRLAVANRIPGWLPTWSRALARTTLRLTAVVVPIALLALGLLGLAVLQRGRCRDLPTLRD